MDLYLPALPALSRDLSASTSDAQLTLTACLVGLGSGQLLSGPLSDRFGQRRPLMIGVSIYAVASLLCAFAPNVSTLYALRLLQGLAGAAGIVIARAVVRDLYDGREAAHFFALLVLISGSAPVLAPVIGGQLVRFTSWRGLFVVLAGVGVALALATLALPETLPVQRRHAGRLRSVFAALVPVLRDVRFLGYALVCGLGFAALFAYIAASPFVLQDIAGLSPQLCSLVFAANAIGVVVVGQVTGRLVHRVPLHRLLVVGSSVASIGALALLAVVLSVGVRLPGVPALFLVVASVGMLTPTATALALSAYGGSPGSASAVLGTLQFALGALVAPLVGVAGSQTAAPMAVVIAIADLGALTAAVLSLRAARPAMAQ